MKILMRALSSAAVGTGLILSSLVLMPVTAHAEATAVYDGDGPEKSNIITDKCEADVAVLGVRGSGQDMSRGVPAQTGQPADMIDGFSNEAATAAYELQQQFPASTKMRFIPINYRAVGPINGVLESPIDTAAYGKLMTTDPTDLKTYKESVQTGVSLTMDTVVKLTDTCPNTKIVIIGYSQGAQVVHQTVFSLAPKYTKRIAAALMIADPTRQPDDTSVANYDDLGSGVQDKSNLQNTGSLTWRLSPNKVPEEMKGRALSVCFHKDVVCNAPTVLDLSSHGTIYQKQDHADLYQIPGRWVYDRVMEMPDKAAEKPASPSAKCTDVTVIGARGSGDAETGGKPNQEVGMFGVDTMATYYYQIKADLPKGTSASYISAPYAMDLSSGLDLATSPEYIAAITSGTESLKKTVKDTMTACPLTSVQIVGNNQGAHIAREASIALSKEGYAGNIGSILLISDALRNADDKGVTEFSGNGFIAMSQKSALNPNGGLLKKLGESRGVSVFPSNLSGKVMTVCHGWDSQCQPEPTTKTDDGSYFDGYWAGSFYTDSSQWVANKVIRQGQYQQIKVPSVKAGQIKFF